MEEFKKIIKKILLEELETTDSKIYNFLIRRVRVEERDLGTDWYGDNPLKVTEYKFEGLPGYGFNSFSSKKDMVYKVLEMLIEETNLIGDWYFNNYPLNINNPERQKCIATIRKFVDDVTSEKK